jgi:hypothetical protein
MAGLAPPRYRRGMKKSARTRLSIFGALALAAALGLTVTAQSDTPAGRETFNGFAVDIGGSDRGSSTSHVRITVDRWSTPEDTRRLVSAFRESGDEALLKELRKMKSLGRISTPDSIGYELRYATQTTLASGARRVLIATDRPLSYWETVNRPRSINYPFTFIEMRIGPNGKGEGKMTVATKVNALGDTIELENYDLTPVQLSSITASRK